MSGCSREITDSPDLRKLYQILGFKDVDHDGVIEKSTFWTSWTKEGYKEEVDINNDEKITEAEAKYYLQKMLNVSDNNIQNIIANSDRAKILELKLDAVSKMPAQKKYQAIVKIVNEEIVEEEFTVKRLRKLYEAALKAADTIEDPEYQIKARNEIENKMGDAFVEPLLVLGCSYFYHPFDNSVTEECKFKSFIENNESRAALEAYIQKDGFGNTREKIKSAITEEAVRQGSSEGEIYDFASLYLYYPIKDSIGGYTETWGKGESNEKIGEVPKFNEISSTLSHFLGEKKIFDVVDIKLGASFRKCIELSANTGTWLKFWDFNRAQSVNIKICNNTYSSEGGGLKEIIKENQGIPLGQFNNFGYDGPLSQQCVLVPGEDVFILDGVCDPTRQSCLDDEKWYFYNLYDCDPSKLLCR